MLRKDADKAGLDNPKAEQLEAFEILKKALVPLPILSLLKLGPTFIIETDARVYQIRYTLLQEQGDNSYLPFRSLSRSLNPAEQNYTVTELE